MDKLEAYDRDVYLTFEKFLKNQPKELQEYNKLVEAAFKAQRKFLSIALVGKKPGPDALPGLLAETSKCIESIQSYREKVPRSHKYFNHFSAVSESIPALGWVTVSPTPAPFIREFKEAGEFYGNRVLKDGLDTEWAKDWQAVLKSMETHVKAVHTTGLVWGTGGAPVGPPPPLPPPPPMDGDDFSMPAPSATSALFAEINRGEGITSMLKKTVKVSGGGGGGSGFGSGAPGSRSANQAQSTKPPVFELVGKKWVVEHQVGAKDLSINGQMSQVIYAFNCKDTVLKVTGKVNSIQLDSCKKLGLVFDSVVSSVEFVNCISCQAQVTQTVPTITIDKSDGLELYLNKESLGVEIVSSKSSGLNVLIPKGPDYVELAVPEQYKTTIVGGRLVTVPNESLGV